jgi:Rap1a immunity proteins
MKRYYLIALILLGSLVAFAHASDIRGTKDGASSIADSGNDFLRVCGNESITNTNYDFCLGYVYGARGMFELDPAYNRLMCAPVGVTLGQQHSIVVKYIRDNPKFAHEATVKLISWALIDAFPCPKK